MYEARDRFIMYVCIDEDADHDPDPDPDLTFLPSSLFLVTDWVWCMLAIYIELYTSHQNQNHNQEWRFKQVLIT